MKEESLKKLLGKQCKIVTKEPGDEKNHIVIGVIKEIEYDEEFIIIESSHGVGCPKLHVVPVKSNKDVAATMHNEMMQQQVERSNDCVAQTAKTRRGQNVD